MALTFDGDGLCINLDSLTTVYTAEFIYSRWKDWVQGGETQYPEAFRIVGGDDLGGGTTAPSFIFLREDYGWKIKKPEATIEVSIKGNLVPQTPGEGMFKEPEGAFNPTINIERSSVAASGIPEATLLQILEIWKDRGLDDTDPVIDTPTSHATQSGDITKQITGDCETQVTTQRL